MTGPDTTIVEVEVDGSVVEVPNDGGAIAAVPRDLPRSRTQVIEGGGVTLIPGLHDHHLHLLAMAAADASVDGSTTSDATDFDDLIRAAAGNGQTDGWLRVVGLDARHGPLDRQR